MGKIKKILENELVGGTQSTDVYPVTSTKAVYDTNNKVLDDYIQHLKKTSTFAGIATPTTNPGTPDGPVFYIAGEGTYANFSNIVIEAGQLGILKWNGTWSKEVLEIGAGGGSGGNGSGSGVSLGTLLTKLNSDNPFPTDNGQVLTYDGSNFIWKIPTGSGSRLKPLEVLNKNGSTFFDYNGEIGYRLRFGNGLSMSLDGDEYVVTASGGSGGGSGSSGTTSGKLYFYKDGSEESWNGESNFRIIFGSGLNVTWDNHSQITLSATGGSGGGSTSTSVSWQDVTGKPSTFTPSSHTHSASDITGLSGVKVNNASAADKLTSSIYLWGNSFNGTQNIGSSNAYADLRYVKNIYAGNVFDIKAGNNSLLKVDNNPNIYVGFDYKANANASILLFGNKTKIYTNDQNYHFDFISNVFDINSNQIHFGSETNGGKISWDAANNAFKIEGNVYATGGITALGVSNNATTSNNVDFTFRNVTANTFNVMDSIQLSNTLKLRRNANDIDLVSVDVEEHYLNLDGSVGNYYLSTTGEAAFSVLNCETLCFAGANDFRIINTNTTGFTIQFECEGRTYNFTPSSGSVTVS